MANKVLLGNVKGDPGATGATGATGVPGANGLTPYIQNGTWWLGTQDTGVTATGNQWFTGAELPTTQGINGDLYLNTSNGDVYKKANGVWNIVANIKGQKGEQGIQGERGETALTFNVGTTTTTESGTNASVSNVGSGVDIVLNFSIPRGEQGIQGEQGVQGEQGIQGEKGEKGDMPELDQSESDSTTSVPSSAYLKSVVSDINERISNAGSNGFAFDTYTHFIEWLNGNYILNDGTDRTISDLRIGSEVYIEETGIPDYWCSSLIQPITSANFTAIEAKGDVDKEYVNTAIQQAILDSWEASY